MKSKKSQYRRPFSYYLGTGMMFFAVLFLFFIYIPLLLVYFFPAKVVVADAISQTPRVYIPKIGVESPVVEDVDPWNPGEYNKALQGGVAHAEGTSLPGEEGTSFLFAHSSDVPWRITQYNTAFYRLGELVLGDEIIVDREGARYIYKVTGKREVWPDETKYLSEDQGDVLILQTCTPVGTSLRRLLVFAEKSESLAE